MPRFSVVIAFAFAVARASVAAAAPTIQHRSLRLASRHVAHANASGAKSSLKCYAGHELEAGELTDCSGDDNACFVRFRANPETQDMEVARYCTSACIPTSPAAFAWYQVDGAQWAAKCCTDEGCNRGVAAGLTGGLYFVQPSDDEEKFLTKGEGDATEMHEFQNTPAQKWHIVPTASELDSAFILTAMGASAGTTYDVMQVGPGKYSIESRPEGSPPLPIAGPPGSSFKLVRTTSWEVGWRGKRCEARTAWPAATDPEACQAACEADPQGCDQAIQWDTENHECFKVTGPCTEEGAEAGGDSLWTYKTKCAGVTCGALDSCHLPGVCALETGQCSNPTVEDGAGCDDGHLHTVNDVCHAGVCAGEDLCAGVTCHAESQCHDEGTCDHTTGRCVSVLKGAGAACNDGNANTIDDICNAGVCEGRDLCHGVTCNATSSCHLSGVCDIWTGVCSTPTKPDASTCDDGNSNTIDDACHAGICTGTGRCDNVNCQMAGPCYEVGECDPASGMCSNPYKSEGAPCDDGSPITVDDQCNGFGVCAGTDHCAGVVCTVDTAAHPCQDAGTCNPANGECSLVEKPNGASCVHDDADLVGAPGQCTAGSCVAIDLCLGVVCTRQSECHEIGECNHATGVCSNPLREEGAECDDNNAMTGPDTCTSAGICFGPGTTTQSTTTTPTTTTTTTTSTTTTVTTTPGQTRPVTTTTEAPTTTEAAPTTTTAAEEEEEEQ